MSYSVYPKYQGEVDIPHNPFQQRILNRSLVTRDIEGAQSKRLHYYVDRRLQNNVTNANQEILMQSENSQLRPKGANSHFDSHSQGRRQYQYDMMLIPHAIVPQGVDYFLRGGKKHYQEGEGEIKQYNALENRHDVPNPLSDEFDRALQTKDIDGAIPGTLISKVVKNKEIAQKLKMRQLQDKLMEVKNEEIEYQKYIQSNNRAQAQKSQAPILFKTGQQVLDEPQIGYSKSYVPIIQPQQEVSVVPIVQPQSQQVKYDNDLHILYAELLKERQLNAELIEYNKDLQNKPNHDNYNNDPSRQIKMYPQQDGLKYQENRQFEFTHHDIQNQSQSQQQNYGDPKQYDNHERNAYHRNPTSQQYDHPHQQNQMYPQKYISQLPMKNQYTIQNPSDKRYSANQDQLMTQSQLQPKYTYGQQPQMQYIKSPTNELNTDGRDIGVDEIGNQSRMKPIEQYEVRTLNQNRPQQMIRMENFLNKVPAAQYKPRPF